MPRAWWLPGYARTVASQSGPETDPRPGSRRSFRWRAVPCHRSRERASASLVRRGPQEDLGSAQEDLGSDPIAVFDDAQEPCSEGKTAIGSDPTQEERPP